MYTPFMPALHSAAALNERSRLLQPQALRPQVNAAGAGAAAGGERSPAEVSTESVRSGDSINSSDSRRSISSSSSGGSGSGSERRPSREPGVPPSPRFAATLQCCRSRLDAFFLITERESSIEQEIRAGAVSFVTMAYILIVNAQILSKSGPDASGEWMNFDAIVCATAISAALGSALVGLWGNLPFGLAPGMGLNSYFTYGVCLKMGLSWRVALTSCFVQGALLVLLALCGACDLLQLYAPPCIKKSITVGLGLFQALIGFELMRLVIPGTDTLLSIGDLSDMKIYLSLAGMMLICVLLVWKVKAAMLVGIMGITLCSWILGLTAPPAAVVEMPQLMELPFLLLDWHGFMAQLRHTLPVTLVMLFVSVLDTAGVQYMCGTEAELMDEETDTLPGAKAAFCSAGIATAVGALLGTSPVIIHNETVAGISDGARTGLHSVTVACLFLLSMPFIPILRAVPPIAAAAPLVIVGMCMMMAAKFIDWESTHEAMPAFLCATLLPFTYSIANGMCVGLVAYALLKSAHKFGELVAPARFLPPPVKCSAHLLKCACEQCVRLAAAARARGLSDAEEGVVVAEVCTPKRHVQKEVFDDPMPGAPTFPFQSSPMQTARHHTHFRQPLSTAVIGGTLPPPHSAPVPPVSARSAGDGFRRVQMEGARSSSPPNHLQTTASLQQQQVLVQ